MSTRVLGLLTTTTVAALALGAGAAFTAWFTAPHGGESPTTATVAAAAAAPTMTAVPPTPPAAPPATAPTSKPTATPAAKPVAADGTDLAACGDGECEVVVKDGQEIKLDDRFGMAPIGVDINGSQVTFEIRDDNSTVVTSIDGRRPGSTVHYNGLTLKPRFVEGRLVIAVSHRNSVEN